MTAGEYPAEAAAKAVRLALMPDDAPSGGSGRGTRPARPGDSRVRKRPLSGEAGESRSGVSLTMLATTTGLAARSRRTSSPSTTRRARRVRTNSGLQGRGRSTSLAKRLVISKQSVVKILRESGPTIRRQPLTRVSGCRLRIDTSRGQAIRWVAVQRGRDFKTARQALLSEAVSRCPPTGGRGR
jgi:hypothetical protein